MGGDGRSAKNAGTIFCPVKDFITLPQEAAAFPAPRLLL